MTRTVNMTALYSSGDVEVTFTATWTVPWDDEMDYGFDNIKVEEAVILGVPVMRADVPAALWAQIEALADIVEFEAQE